MRIGRGHDLPACRCCKPALSTELAVHLTNAAIKSQEAMAGYFQQETGGAPDTDTSPRYPPPLRP
jgi:hypothetical protein